MSPWQTFLKSSHTLGPTPGVRELWRAGRHHYAVWALPVLDQHVLKRAKEVQQALAGHIEPTPLEQLHITVWVGGFLDGDGTRNDDLDRKTWAAIQGRIQALRRPIPVEISGLSSFQSCPFLKAQPIGSELQALREKIRDIQPKEIRFSEYTPHLTLGTYSTNEAIGPLIERLLPYRDLPTIRLQLQAHEARVDAATGHLSWV